MRQLIRAVLALHSTWREEIWLWRGHSLAEYRLEPGMHSRLRNTEGIRFDEANVRWATNQLIGAARERGLDAVEELRLPDLALLAHLQHHGAATPMLDVTVDPLVGLWMVAHASGSDPTSDDRHDGALIGIRRPIEERWLSSLDSRPYWRDGFSDISTAIAAGVHWYRAPDISERLRIQRGSFLLGPLVSDDEVTLPLDWDPGDHTGWLQRRIGGLGQQGRPEKARTEVVMFRVRGSTKASLRRWLEERAGLIQEVIYPTPWHRPFLEQFCRGYGRLRAVDYP